MDRELNIQAIRQILSRHVLTDGSNNESVDGSGWNPSINPENVAHIFNNVKLLMPFVNWPEANVIDVGCGIGYLTKYLNQEEKILCVGAEGSLDLVEKFVDPDHTVLWDFTKPLEELGINIAEPIFDVSISFEVVEHIHPDHQEQFWNNLKRLSKYHFCSIHTENGVNEYHKNMMSEYEWIEYFNFMGIKIIKVVPREWWIKNVVAWECSSFFILEL